jgi:thiazole synthase
MSVIDAAHADLQQPWLVVDGQPFRSRLLVGIEQYESASLVGQVLEASGSDVFITTMDPGDGRSSLLLSDVVSELPDREFRWIGTTSFARSADAAIATARMLRDCHGINVMKLDVRSAGNRPDNAATIAAARTLRADGMHILPFILPSVTDAQALQALGCAALRVMAAPVGSGYGIPGPGLLREVIEHTDLPVIVEGGLGTAWHAALAMELGAAGVLVNTALVRAQSPLLLATAMKHAVRAGRLAYLSGPMKGGPVPAG